MSVRVSDGVGVGCVDSSLVRERRDCLVGASDRRRWCRSVLMVSVESETQFCVDSSLVRERMDCLVEAFGGKRELLSGQQVLLVGDSQQQYYL